MELLDGGKLKKIRKSAGLSDEQLLDRSGLDNIQHMNGLEDGSRVATFKTLLLLSRIFQLPLKDFMPDETEKIIYSQSEKNLKQARNKYAKRTTDYPLLGAVDEVDLKTICEIEKNEFNKDPEIKTVRYASYSDSTIYALKVGVDAAAPDFLLNSVVLISPGTTVKNGDYCLICDLRSGNRYIRSILIREGYYILQPEEEGGSLILSDNQLVVHKIIGSAGVPK